MARLTATRFSSKPDISELMKMFIGFPTYKSLMKRLRDKATISLVQKAHKNVWLISI